MKINAIIEHECFHCGRTIKKGEECYVLFCYPENPEEKEFEPFYVCMDCPNKKARDQDMRFVQNRIWSTSSRSEKR